mmetsp:Transcript_28058/g.70450  ORF Transcript_28058/g.70450 Transcript_28058/m.70450 type:complete len:112 (+) Transcript_28058:644-979(+)
MPVVVVAPAVRPSPVARANGRPVALSAALQAPHSVAIAAVEATSGNPEPLAAPGPARTPKVAGRTINSVEPPLLKIAIPGLAAGGGVEGLHGGLAALPPPPLHEQRPSSAR